MDGRAGRPLPQPPGGGEGAGGEAQGKSKPGGRRSPALSAARRGHPRRRARPGLFGDPGPRRRRGVRQARAGGPPSVPVHRRARGRGGAGEPTELHPKPHGPDGAGPRDPARLGRGRSPQHRPPPYSHRGPRRHRGREDSQHRGRLHRPRHKSAGLRDRHPGTRSADRTGGAAEAPPGGGQDRFTRLDAALLKEVNDEGLIDLRPGAEQSYLGRANRYLLIDRLKKLERLDLAQEIEPGRWSLSSAKEQTPRPSRRAPGDRRHHAPGVRTAGRRAQHRALRHPQGRGDFPHRWPRGRQGTGGRRTDRTRQYLVIDGIDGRAHYVEIAEPDQLDDVRRGGIVEVAPPPTEPRAADRTIAAVGARQSRHLPAERTSHRGERTVRVPHDDYDGYVEAHVRRLEALRRAGIVERIDADHWIIPDDFEQRAADYDAQRRRTLSVRVLSAFDLEAQISVGRRDLARPPALGRDRADPMEAGFGREVIDAKHRRVQVLIEQGFAERQGENRLRVRRDLLATLEQREVTRVGQELAEKRSTPFRPAKDGERIYGTFKETVQLASGKYALIENSREFTLVPWRPVIERELGKEVAGLVRGNDISWEFGRKRSLGISI